MKQRVEQSLNSCTQSEFILETYSVRIIIVEE